MERPTLPILRKQIMVVEDNADVRQILTRILEIEGYFVLETTDGQHALNMLNRIKPDLILSDIHMPNLNGIEFYKAVRNNPDWVAVPFIFLTSMDHPDEIRAGRELGVEDYLTKPIDGAELVKIVNARLLRTAQVQIALIDQAYLDTVNVLANSIEGRDPYTHGHVERVATYARWLGEALEWPDENMRLLEFGSRLHDIGKIIIPDEVLKKNGPLSADEWELMKQHTLAGARIIGQINHLQGILPYILHHHERWDGSGYPHNLCGREISVEGRLLALADVYDALTTNRPYHPARPHNEVVTFLQIKSGTYFDPDLVAIFINLLNKRVRLSQSINASQ